MRGVGWWCVLSDLSDFDMFLNSQRFILSILKSNGSKASTGPPFFYGRFTSCKT
jgi:hypothetical protein